MLLSLHKYYGHNLQQQLQQEQQQFSHKIFLGRWPEKEQGKERERKGERGETEAHLFVPFLVAGCPDNLSPVANCWRGIEMSASTSTRVYQPRSLSLSLVPTRSLSMPVKFAMMDEPTTCASPVRTSVSTCLPPSFPHLPLSRQLIYECDCLALFPLGKTFPFALSPSCNLSLVCPALSQ